MLEVAKYQLNMYKKILVSLCKKHPEDTRYYKTLYRGKVDGVLDMLAYDDSFTTDKYVEVTQELKESFEREVSEMLK